MGSVSTTIQIKRPQVGGYFTEGYCETGLLYQPVEPEPIEIGTQYRPLYRNSGRTQVEAQIN